MKGEGREKGDWREEGRTKVIEGRREGQRCLEGGGREKGDWREEGRRKKKGD